MRNLFQLSLLLFIVIAVNHHTFGQHQWGVKASGGFSKITNSKEVSSDNFTTPFVPSGQVGLFYNLSMGEKSSLGAELLVSQIEGKEQGETTFMDDFGHPNGQATTLFYRHISYLSLPVYYGFNLKRLTIHGGFQISCALASSGREKNDAIINEVYQENYSYDRKTDHLSITSLNFGYRAGVIYHLTRSLAIEANYYYGTSNIHQTEPVSWEWKVQQMNVGIRYALWSKTLQ